MRVLITGGAGFIGSHLVRRLIGDPSLQTAVLDNFHRGSLSAISSNLERVSVITGDVRDAATVRRATRETDIVFHLAAQSSVITASTDRNYTISTNIDGTRAVLEAAAAEGVKRVVFASSREVYGDPETLPVREDFPLDPKNDYGFSKVAGEALCRELSSRMEIFIVRLANVYGPGDRDRVLPIFIKNALEGSPITLFGGQQVLDFVYIGQVVDALVKAGLGPFFPEPVNVGSGKGTTVAQAAERVLRATGSRSEVRIEPVREIEVSRFIADVSRAREVFGLTPPDDPLFMLGTVIESAQATAA